MDMWTFFIFAFTSLLTIVNPFSAAAMFVTITEGNTKKELRQMSRKAAVVSCAVLVAFAIGGNYILGFFAVSIEAFMIAGGLLISKVGLEMVRNKERTLKSEKEKHEAIKKQDVSIVPMAIPMLSGPGAMTTSIVLMQQAQGAGQVSILLGSIIAVSIITFVILYYAHGLNKYLGVNGKNVIERIMGLLVLVVGVQFFINGARGLLIGWGLIG